MFDIFKRYNISKYFLLATYRPIGPGKTIIFLF